MFAWTPLPSYGTERFVVCISFIRSRGTGGETQVVAVATVVTDAPDLSSKKHGAV